MDQNQIKRLEEKLEALVKRQEDFSKEVQDLKNQLANLSKTHQAQPKEVEEVKFQLTTEKKPQAQASIERLNPVKEKSNRDSNSVEKFIGENLFNKVGIAVLIIGVAMGAKYSIEHGLLSPAIRIMLGYLAGLGLLGIGLKLKKKYLNYSAVLVSGSISILYFITYSAHAFYEFIPQHISFILMVLFTCGAVYTALKYNLQIIALIGLVGAYAVPFLLSDGSGKVLVLYTYMAIINAGILAIALKKNWKQLYYSAFAISWIIFLSWFSFDYSPSKHFGIALSFGIIFSLLFYLTFLAYKILQKDEFRRWDVAYLLINSFIFYLIGYNIISRNNAFHELLGVFTIAHSALHLAVFLAIRKLPSLDKKLLSLISGLALIFASLFVSVQFDGNLVSVIWILEACLLYWIGRTKGSALFEKMSYPLMMIAVVSLFNDWNDFAEEMFSRGGEMVQPILNANFLGSFIFVLAFSFINYIHHITKEKQAVSNSRMLTDVLKYGLPGILIFLFYYSFFLEINHYWEQLYRSSGEFLRYNEDGSSYYMKDFDYRRLNKVWLLNYSMFFTSAIAIFNWKKIRSKDLSVYILVLMQFALVVFLIQGLYEISELRISVMKSGGWALGIRYISLLFVGILLMAAHFTVRQEFLKNKLTKAFNISLFTTVVWLLSSELISWLHIGGYQESYKLGLSILWGLSSLFCIAYGIWKKKAHLRILGMVFFGITICKLIVYDLDDLSTISKTIVFVSLGVLLLVSSFLYNKYKGIIEQESD